MRKFLLRTCLMATSVALSGLLACGTTDPHNTPGALPTSKGDAEPRLNASTYVAHGDLLERQGNYEQAIVQYRHALQLTPDSAAARSRLGITLNKLGRHSEASAEFREALARTPDVPHLHNNLGFSLYLEDKLEEAERALARAVQLQPAFRRAQMNHGLVLAKLGRFDEALAAFCLAGSEADAHFNLAVMQAEAGRYADAARSLEQALKLNPDFAAARQQLREIARLAAAEEAEGSELAKTGRTTPDPASRAPNAAPPTDFQTTAGRDPAPETRPPANGRTDEVDAEEAARVFEAVESWLAAVYTLRPLSALKALDPGRLRDMLDEFVDALILSAHQYESSLCRLQEVLGLRDTLY